MNFIHIMTYFFLQTTSKLITLVLFEKHSDIEDTLEQVIIFFKATTLGSSRHCPQRATSKQLLEFRINCWFSE